VGKNLESFNADWIKFNKQHKDSWQTIQVDGETKIHWKCTCGEEKIVAANPGFIVGVKVMWRNHFQEMKREGRL
jgi:hypothetical protein